LGILVQKYGGKCVATPALIKQVAQKVIEARRAGHSVLVVMSAMGHKTDELIELAREVSENPSPSELDMLITVGEGISISLLSMAISDLGFDSISFTGSQSGIITSDKHNRARIIAVRPERIVESLRQGKIVIVAGFQGVSKQKEITTLGRGGSDLTAVVLTKALNADVCELRKSVPGVMSADPDIVPDARLLDKIDPEKLLELACAGASVVHQRAAQFVRRHKLAVVVCSGASDGSGTMIESKDEMNKVDDLAGVNECPEAASIDAVVSTSPVCGVHVEFPRGSRDTVIRVFEGMSGLGVSLDMVTHTRVKECQHLRFVVSEEDSPIVERVLTGVAADSSGSWFSTPKLAKVGIVGDGFLSDPSIIARIHQALLEAGVAPLETTVSALRISLLVTGPKEEHAVRAIHRLCGGKDAGT